jgi:hypothetical protein
MAVLGAMEVMAEVMEEVMEEVMATCTGVADCTAQAACMGTLMEGECLEVHMVVPQVLLPSATC